MKAKRIREGIGLLLLLVSLLILSWGIWPLPKEERVVTILAEEMRQPADINLSASLTYDERILKLAWPAKLRSGDGGTIRLSLNAQLVEAEEISSPEPTSQGNPEILETDDSGTVAHPVVEAYLETRGMEVLPKGRINQALIPGKPVTFIWDIKSLEEGTLPVVIWLHLRFVPPVGETEVRKLLSAQRMEIQSIRFLGLDGPSARILGVFGCALGVLFNVERIARRIHPKASVDSG